MKSKDRIEFLIAKSRVDSLYEMAKREKNEHIKKSLIATAIFEEKKLYKKYPQFKPTLQLSLDLGI